MHWSPLMPLKQEAALVPPPVDVSMSDQSLSWTVSVPLPVLAVNPT